MDISNLKHLAIFSKVIECGSFAEAARQLQTSRSRVSEQVLQLEKALGVKLIHRSTRQLSISEEGQSVYEQAKSLMDILDNVVEVTAYDVPKGKVRITTSNHIAHNYFLPILDDISNIYPEIQIDLIVSDERLDLIKESIDLAIRTDIPEDSSSIVRVMHTEIIGIFASQRYIDLKGMPSTITELENRRWVTLEQKGKTCRQYFHQDGVTKTVSPKHVYSCNSPLFVEKMIRKGIGIGSMLSTKAYSDDGEGKLIPVMPDLKGPSLSVSLVYPDRKLLPFRTRCVIDFLMKCRWS